MRATGNLQGNRPLSKTPIQRSKRPLVLVIKRDGGRRPSLEKLQEENRRLQKALDSLLLRFQLAANNPGAALYPSIREYLTLREQWLRLWNKFNTTDQTTKEADALMHELEALRRTMLAAQEKVITDMDTYLEHRIAGRYPQIPLLTVDA